MHHIWFTGAYLWKRKNINTINNTLHICSKWKHSALLGESPSRHTACYEADCLRFRRFLLDCTNHQSATDEWPDPRKNWEAIFVLLDILSLTPSLYVHDVIGSCMQLRAFVCVHCMPAVHAGKGQEGNRRRFNWNWNCRLYILMPDIFMPGEACLSACSSQPLSGCEVCE